MLFDISEEHATAIFIRKLIFSYFSTLKMKAALSSEAVGNDLLNYSTSHYKRRQSSILGSFKSGVWITEEDSKYKQYKPWDWEPG
jgi:hypothetical protein